ncbi:hypothetical protein evm_014601 [Chilo suppressalis]|nr:hypothetical protein evm_014601 [Chilo suppressalis]
MRIGSAPTGETVCGDFENHVAARGDSESHGAASGDSKSRGAACGDFERGLEQQSGKVALVAACALCLVCHEFFNL